MRRYLYARPPHSCAPIVRPFYLVQEPGREENAALEGLHLRCDGGAGSASKWLRRTAQKVGPYNRAGCVHILYDAVLQGKGRVLFVRQIIRYACYSEHKRGRCGRIWRAASVVACSGGGLGWGRCLLYADRPARSKRGAKDGEIWVRSCYISVLLLLLWLLLLLLEFVLVRQQPAFPVSFSRYSSSGRCAFSVGCISTWA